MVKYHSYATVIKPNPPVYHVIVTDTNYYDYGVVTQVVGGLVKLAFYISLVLAVSIFAEK